MVGTAVGKFAFLTSRRYGTQEWERVILSCFRIDRLGDIPRVGSHAVAASTDSPYTLRVPVDRLGHAPRFWDFRAAAEAQDWRTGLFRYVPDHEAAAMREAVAALCEGIDVPVWRDVDASRQEEEYVEGQRSARLVSYYERNPRLRSAAIRAHGTRCQACGFDFARRYGDLGAGFIEVHHLRPVAGYHAQVAVDPREDMRVVCPNCHRMIHRHPAQPLTVEQLRTILSSRRV
jgi:predicted HNH restriction endonuclease